MTRLSLVKRFLTLVVALGLATSVWTLWVRSRAPQGGPGTEIVVRLETVYESCRLHGLVVDELLEALRRAGVTTVAVEAKSLARMEYAGQVVLTRQTGSGLYNVSPTPAGSGLGVWLAEELDVWSPGGRVTAGDLGPGSLLTPLPATYPKPRKDRVPLPTEVFTLPSDPLATPLPERDLLLGLSPADVALARQHGFLVAAFLPNRPGLTADQALFALRGLGSGDGFSAVRFDGAEALGWPDPGTLRAVGVRLAELGVPFVAEDGQAGLDTVAEAAGWRGVRWQPVWLRTEPTRFPEVARERRATFLYLESAFFDGTTPDWLAQVTRGVTAIVKALEAEGLRLGRTQPLTPFSTAPWALATAAAGALAATLLGLLLVFEPFPAGPAGRYSWLLLTVAGALVLAVAAVTGWRPTGLALKARVTVSFLAGLAFPVLGVGVAFRLGPGSATTAGAADGTVAGFRRRWGVAWRVARAVGATVSVAAVAVTGGLFTVAVAADTSFMLHLNASFGTKVSLLAVPLLAALLYLGQVGLYPRGRPRLGAETGWTDASIAGRALGQVVRVLGESITVGHLLLLVLVGVAGLVYLTRSGNFPIIPVAALEARFRSFLQQALLVRPRTKEFLIGYPALMLLLYWGARWRDGAARRWSGLILAVGAAIGLLSIANSFAHLHVPVSVSLRRAVNGLGLGLPLGLAVLAASEAAARIFRRRRPLAPEGKASS